MAKKSKSVPQPAQYEERIVAFIDILGFKALIQSTDTQDEDKNTRAIQEVLDIYEEIETRLVDQLQEMMGTVDITRFSDCIVISFPARQSDGLFELTLALSWFHLDIFMRFNVLIRGAITQGKLIHTKDLVFGPAMNRAYELESTVAIFPRIIIDNIVFQGRIDWFANEEDGEVRHQIRNEMNTLLENDGDEVLSLDTDDFYYVDYIGKIAGEMDDPETQFPVYMKKLSHIVEKNIGSKNASISKKYQWIANKIQPYLDFQSQKKTD